MSKYEYIFRSKLKKQEEKSKNPGITINHSFLGTSVFPILAQFFSPS